MRELNLGTLKRAIEGNDAATLSGLFAENAMLRIVDSIHPPSHPLDLKGRKKIAEFYADVCGRGVTHHVADMVSGDGHLAFTEECEYPGGAKVFCSAMLDVDKDGRITREVMVQAWDDDER
ncbi:hypothetical protein IZ6_29110 [Terrihabitans soli]|uniref:SnoaL-like domain-containing protein n=1 Tax=Terrihabitans soli TaxID=708113 RepID=A0A6S6QRE5_9HYPH|nr:nuclear transport factor 2 family protein [Terrihabitans soli]BCJ92176.1 hypothetical protein IZ6_29110 [Terrihabitans soli]